MRIRKNAKISALLCTSSNLSTDANECLLQKNLCQLNQSPWDIITFPSSDSSSSLHQFDDNEVYYNVDLAGNGSSIDSLGDFESVASKTSGLGENDNANRIIGRQKDHGECLGFKEEGEASDIEKESKLCGKRNEKGWQRGCVVKNGNHLSELQNYSVSTTKKKSRPTSGLITGTRPKRAKKRPTTNPHDFYYYSGFGPSWGKKRGTASTVSNEATCVDSYINLGCGKGGIDGEMDVQEETRKRFEFEVGPMELDCIDEDDNDDQKIRSGFIGKKRGRKPIKERSLKSLM